MSTAFFYGYLTFIVFVFGACWGSFLNVCIWRIPREESVVHPRSHCPKCNNLIAWYDNLPLISFLALNAHCRHCGTRISARYFVVELLTAVLFTFVWLKYGLSLLTPIYWLLVFGLILGSFVDCDHLIIPDRVSYGGWVAGLLLSPLVPALHDRLTAWTGFREAVIGLAVGGGLLLLVSVIGRLIFRKDAMGLGDVKLLGGLGALLGWPAVLFIVMAASFLGSFIGIYLIIRRGRRWRSRIPFGPYLAGAAVLWILGGKELWFAYLRWLAGGVY